MDLQLSDNSCSDRPGGCRAWYEGDYFFNPRFVQEMWWSAMVNRGREEFGNIDIPVFQGNSSLAVQGRFYASMLADKATGQGQFYGEGPDELLAYEFFGPQGVGDLAGLESEGSPLDIFLFAASPGFFRSLGKYTLEDFIRWVPTRVPKQLVDGPGTKGSVRTWAIKGGGVNRESGAALPYHFHIHRYNWYKPWLWFKYTPTL